ncbi:MAG: hypothetical protein H6673_02315 [Anaerolineales bacterium]|nr:hypothetical protein [Anaerolineales bacterium]
MRTYDAFDIDQKKMPIEFIAPVSLEKAVGTLQHQHQEATFWAWKGQRRTVVKIHQIDSYVYAYRAWKAPKSWLGGAYYNIEIKGYLKRVDDYSTLVVGEPHIPLLSMLFMSFILIFMFGFLAFMITFQPEEDSSGIIFPIIFMLFIGPIMIGTLFWEKWQLTTMIKNTLGRGY